MKDLSGNGHDIQLYNFAFSGESGYGKYAVDDFNSKWYVYGMQSYDKGKYHITFKERDAKNTDLFIYFQNSASNLPVGSYHFTGFKYRITNPGNYSLKAIFRGDESIYSEDVSASGVYTFPSIDLEVAEGNTKNYGFQLSCTTSQSDDLGVTVEIIPDYRGALVSDGIDDYGLCENFPVFTQEKGYTVCAIREWIQEIGNHSCLISKNYENSPNYGSFVIETNGNSTSSWGRNTAVIFERGVFTFQRSDIYNTQSIKQSNCVDGNDLCIFKYHKTSGNRANIALYAFEIYDRDLTDDEIAKVKSRMIAEYESKTGNKYEEEAV